MVADMAADCVIGVDLGGTKVLAGAVDAEQQVHHRAQRTVLGLAQVPLLEAIGDAVEEVRAAAPDAPEAAGFGIPSLIDQSHGTAVMSVNLPIADMPFRDVMSERLDLPVFMDNDGNVAALAEHRYGAARGARHSLMLTVGTGIGGGLILDDEIFRGATGSGAELGHMVIDQDGPRCQGNCPNHGCLEAVAAGALLLQPARDEVAVRALRPNKDIVRIVPAHFGNEAGMLGAAALAFDGIARREAAGA